MEWSHRDRDSRYRQQTRIAPRRRWERYQSQSFESVQWRLSLHSIFVANIERIVSPMDIWRIFNEYGVVVDVFLPKASFQRRLRYAFVRYRYREELKRAIIEGGKQLVAGRQLRVCPATERNKDRRLDRRSSSRFEEVKFKAAEEVRSKRSKEAYGRVKGNQRIVQRNGSQAMVQAEERPGPKDSKGGYANGGQC